MYKFYITFVVILLIQLAKCAPLGITSTFQMEQPASPFIGRTTELSDIHWKHADGKYVVITGQRGVGKSELARKYAQDFKHDDAETSTIWINSESLMEMISQFRALSAEVGITTTDKKIVALIRDVFEHFNQMRSLFVFDNAEHDNSILINLKKLIGEKKLVSILITSREENWDTEKFTVMKLNGFSKPDAVKFIKIALKDTAVPTDEHLCEELAEALKYLPLALKKSTAHIIRQNSLDTTKTYSISDFLRQLNGNELSTTTTSAPAPQVVDEAWEKQILEQIKDETADIGEKISDGATHAWNQVSSGATDVGQKIAQEASNAGTHIANAAQSAGQSVKKFFKGFG